MIERPRSAPIYAGEFEPIYSELLMHQLLIRLGLICISFLKGCDMFSSRIKIRTLQHTHVPIYAGQVDFRKLSGCLSNVHDVCDFSHQDGSMKTVIR